MKLILAGTYFQFLEWCRENGHNPQARPKTAKFLITYNDFFGIVEAELILYGEYQENPIYKNADLLEFLIEYGRTNRWILPEGW